MKQTKFRQPWTVKFKVDEPYRIHHPKLEQMRLWCEEMCVGDFFSNYKRDTQWYVYCEYELRYDPHANEYWYKHICSYCPKETTVVWQFSNKADALKFKLAWYGR